MADGSGLITVFQKGRRQLTAVSRQQEWGKHTRPYHPPQRSTTAAH
jgi:hypothetical protein